MLILTRKNQESLMIGGLNGRGPPIVVTVVDIVGTVVRLGITAVRDVPVDRLEVHRGKLAERRFPEPAPRENGSESSSHVAP